MKIAFVNDSCERLGVGYISAVLKQRGHQTRLFTDPQLFDDENVHFPVLNKAFSYERDIIAELKQYRPDLIGFSVVTDFYQWACQLARAIKREISVPIIFGGIHPSCVPEKVIINDAVDMVCLGEGEYAVGELIESMARGEVDYSIKNIWFKKDGKIIRNEVRGLISDLNVLPFSDKDIFREASPHFLRCYYIMASRGCPNACSYCCHSYLKKLYANRGKYFRFRSPENVIAELSAAKKKYNLRMIRFHDDDLMAAEPQWLKDFSKEYAREIGVPFACFVHPNTVTPEKAAFLVEAGCHDVEIGVQSVSEKTRREIMDRNISTQRLEDSINVLKKAGLKVITDNILGVPGQPLDEIIDMLKFYNRNRVMKIYCFGFRYYPKTTIITKAFNSGLLKEEHINDLEEGRNVQAFISGGDQLTTEMKQLQTFFAFLLYWPYWFNDLIIKYRLYRLFVPLPYFITVIFSNWLRIPYRYNWALHITITRYRNFILKRIKRNLFFYKLRTVRVDSRTKSRQPLPSE